MKGMITYMLNDSHWFFIEYLWIFYEFILNISQYCISFFLEKPTDILVSILNPI